MVHAGVVAAKRDEDVGVRVVLVGSGYHTFADQLLGSHQTLLMYMRTTSKAGQAGQHRPTQVQKTLAGCRAAAASNSCLWATSTDNSIHCVFSIQSNTTFFFCYHTLGTMNENWGSRCKQAKYYTPRWRKTIQPWKNNKTFDRGVLAVRKYTGCPRCMRT